MCINVSYQEALGATHEEKQRELDGKERRKRQTHRPEWGEEEEGGGKAEGRGSRRGELGKKE
jgi:hypothetical protein